MMSPWLTATHTASGAVLGLHGGVVAPYGVDGAVPHRDHRLARRGTTAADGLRLDGRPELLLRQLPDACALPLAVVALRQPALGDRLEAGGRAVAIAFAGLPAPLLRAGHERRDRDRPRSARPPPAPAAPRSRRGGRRRAARRARRTCWRWCVRAAPGEPWPQQRDVATTVAP